MERIALVNYSAKKPCPVVLLDAGREHLGLVHSLAGTRRYHAISVGFAEDDALRYSRRCRHETLCDWRWNAGCEQLAPLAAELGTAVLLPVSIRAVEWVVHHRAALAEAWRLVPLPDAHDLQVANDKVRLSALARREGAHVPPLVELAELERADWQSLSFPALLKPRQGFGGSGIVRLDGSQDLQRAVSGMTRAANYFVQSFVSGRDVSCGVFCRDGEVLASVAYRPLARQGDFGRFTSIQSLHDADVDEAVSRLMRALHWNGIANVDLVQSHDGRVHVLEVNPRCWGNMSAGLALGVNFADMLCRAALGLPVTRQICRPGRFFDALDAMALLRAALRDRDVRRRLPWRRLLARGSALRLVASDPLPYLASVVRGGLLRGVYALLHEVLTRRAPALSSP
jgi:predicted ATP-grasp superfamily ATP-dependent carboligase